VVKYKFADNYAERPNKNASRSYMLQNGRQSHGTHDVSTLNNLFEKFTWVNHII